MDANTFDSLGQPEEGNGLSAGRSGPSARAAAAAPYSLDIRSFEEHDRTEIGSTDEWGRRNTKVYMMGDFIEVVYLNRPWGEADSLFNITEREETKRDRGRGRGNGPESRLLPEGLKKKHAPAEEEPQRDYSIRNSKRAKTKVRRLALMNNLSYMWSLTHAENTLSDLGDAWHQWKLFTQRMRRAGLMPEKWIATPEVQKERLAKYGDKVWHIHFITNEYISKQALDSKWNKGFTWVSPHRDAGEAASYAAKYVGKEMDTEDRKPGQHRYRASDGLAHPAPIELFLTQEEVLSGHLDAILGLGGRKLIGHCSIQEEGQVFGEWYLSRRSSSSSSPLPSPPVS